MNIPALEWLLNADVSVNYCHPCKHATLPWKALDTQTTPYWTIHSKVNTPPSFCWIQWLYTFYIGHYWQDERALTIIQLNYFHIRRWQLVNNDCRTEDRVTRVIMNRVIVMQCEYDQALDTGLESVKRKMLIITKSVCDARHTLHSAFWERATNHLT